MGEMIATREAFGRALAACGAEKRDIVVLDADLSKATMSSVFQKAFPERFFNVVIAEGDLIDTAAGLAAAGKIPFACTFAVFAAGRAFEQIRNSVAYPKLNVKICGSHGGIAVRSITDPESFVRTNVMGTSCEHPTAGVCAACRDNAP